MIGILIAHGLAALLAPELVKRLGRRAFLPLALVPAAAVVWAVWHTGTVNGGGTVTEVHPWVPTLEMELAFRLDALSLLMTFVAAGVGAVVLAYCARYFSDDEDALGRFAAVLVAFAGAMLGLVLSDDLLLLYVFWELTTVLSFLLVGHQSDRASARRAAMDALIVTTFGGLAMLVGAVIIGEAAGTYRISEILAQPPEATVAVSVGVALLLLGALTKSALVPFHFWLPGAMAAPTPVSAYLHAAAMVKAGVFLVALLAPAFATVAPWRETVLVLGLLTMLIGAFRALRQFDLKLLLAYGTVSQLGLLVVLVGQGSRDVALAGVGLLLAHALYKSALFLVVGIIDKATGTRDLRVLSGIGRARPRLAVIAALAAASMAGVPLFAGFAAKETAFDALLHGDTIDVLTLVTIVIGVALTAAYAARFVWGAFADKPGVPNRRCRTADARFEAAPGVLAVGGLVLGVGFAQLDHLIGVYADTVPAALDEPLHLAAWHGFGLPLLLSLVALFGGLAIAWIQIRRGVENEVNPRHHGYESRDAYVSTIRFTELLSLRAARVTQSGSLPVYLMTILIVLATALTTAVIVGIPWDVQIHVWDTPPNALIGALVVVSAFLTLQARRRLKAVLLSGVIGYSIAVLFALQGAPDLALTQFLVETVTLVVVVLVLRRLPTHFTGTVSQRGRRRLHVVIGITVGALMALVTVLAGGARESVPVSELMAAASVLAGGDNIVNVTLVDLRAWDTMGELAVLVVAATGVTSLLFLRRRTRSMPRLHDADGRPRVWRIDPGRDGAVEHPHRDEPDVPATVDAPPLLTVARTDAGGAGSARRARSWLIAENTLAPERRSIMFEVVVRLIFHAILVVSVYLLIIGHDLPGGGFAAGMVAGLALIVRYLAGGRYELGEAAPVAAGLLIGLGLVIATGTGLAGAIFGDAVLQGGKVHLDIPLLGPLNLYSSTLFDVGVYLVVVGVVLDVVRSFGSEIDRQVDEETHTARPTVPTAPAAAPPTTPQEDRS
ncbi:MAG: Na+/H+ antiporter subunit A [Patulibacter sp.]|nr:Na+/H+ antiporter subunit A [Patulibacter sp.]